jgi:hypothetical protein
VLLRTETPALHVLRRRLLSLFLCLIGDLLPLRLFLSNADDHRLREARTHTDAESDVIVLQSYVVCMLGLQVSAATPFQTNQDHLYDAEHRGATLPGPVDRSRP